MLSIIFIHKNPIVKLSFRVYLKENSVMMRNHITNRVDLFPRSNLFHEQKALPMKWLFYRSNSQCMYLLTDQSLADLGAQWTRPPANEVWGKIIFSQASVILSSGGGGRSASKEGGCSGIKWDKQMVWFPKPFITMSSARRTRVVRQHLWSRCCYRRGLHPRDPGGVCRPP